MTDVVSPNTPRTEPPTTWVEHLDAAIERETAGAGGPLPADLVAGWLAWYAQQVADQHQTYEQHMHRCRAELGRAMRIIRQLTTIIVEELTLMMRWDSELQESHGYDRPGHVPD